MFNILLWSGLLCGSETLAASVSKGVAAVQNAQILSPIQMALNKTAPDAVSDQFGTGGYVEKCMKNDHPNVLWAGFDPDGSGKNPILQMTKVLADAGLNSGGLIYESGCGCGGLLWAASQISPTLTFGGNDLFDTPLNLLKGYFKKDAANFLQKSSDDLSIIPDNSWDASFTMGSLPIIGSLPKICVAFQEMVRITKVGGKAFSLGHIHDGHENYDYNYGGIPTPQDFWQRCFQHNLDTSLIVKVQTMMEAGMTNEELDKNYKWGGYQYITITKVSTPTFTGYMAK